jgi:hypothetical protein
MYFQERDRKLVAGAETPVVCLLLEAETIR